MTINIIFIHFQRKTTINITKHIRTSSISTWKTNWKWLNFWSIGLVCVYIFYLSKINSLECILSINRPLRRLWFWMVQFCFDWTAHISTSCPTKHVHCYWDYVLILISRHNYIISSHFHCIPLDNITNSIMTIPSK